MIRSFADRETERVWEGRCSRRLPGDIQATAVRRLRSLDAAKHLDDLRSPPGSRLEALLGDRRGQYSMRINQQWRLCFRWSGGHAYDVEICDYH
jgi:proteic killer suppression protein